jgi:hypothetical protein
MPKSDVIYSPQMIDAMLRAPKWMLETDWLGEESLPHVRHTPGEKAAKWLCQPDDADSGLEFSVEVRYLVRVGDFCLILQGRQIDDSWQAICRYDMHGNPHPNEPYCPNGEDYLPAGVLHRHLYSEPALIKTGKWDKCAELLPLDGSGTKQERRQRLKNAFRDDMRITLIGDVMRRAYDGADKP